MPLLMQRIPSFSGTMSGGPASVGRPFPIPRLYSTAVWATPTAFEGRCRGGRAPSGPAAPPGAAPAPTGVQQPSVRAPDARRRPGWIVRTRSRRRRRSRWGRQQTGGRGCVAAQQPSRQRVRGSRQGAPGGRRHRDPEANADLPTLVRQVRRVPEQKRAEHPRRMHIVPVHDGWRWWTAWIGRCGARSRRRSPSPP
jgi:hypothetical protein